MIGPLQSTDYLPPLHFNRFGDIPKDHNTGKWRFFMHSFMLLQPPMYTLLQVHATLYTTFDCFSAGSGWSFTLVRRVGLDLNTALMLKSRHTFLILLLLPATYGTGGFSVSSSSSLGTRRAAADRTKARG